MRFKFSQLAFGLEAGWAAEVELSHRLGGNDGLAPLAGVAHLQPADVRAPAVVGAAQEVKVVFCTQVRRAELPPVFFAVEKGSLFAQETLVVPAVDQYHAGVGVEDTGERVGKPPHLALDGLCPSQPDVGLQPAKAQFDVEDGLDAQRYLGF